MEFAEVVRRRRMVRRYADDPVDPAVVDRMLAHALRAPSAGFTQATSWLRLDTTSDVDRFWAATTAPADSTDTGDSTDLAEAADPAEGDAAPAGGSAWLRGMRRAPVVLVALADEAAYRSRYAEPDKTAADQSFDVPWWHVDAGMGVMLVLQSAVDEGLGACFFGVPGARWPSLRDTFGVPDDLVPTGAVTVGHAAPRAGATGGAGSVSRRPRKDPATLVHRGRWSR